jgi:predicted dehydrogenase
MAKELGAGILGMGWAAGEHFKAYQHNAESRVVGVCSRTPEGARAKLAALAPEVSVEGVKVYENHAQMLADPEIDVVSICTPPSQHADQVVAAAQAGKHLCIEKALALNLPDLRRMQTAVKQAGVKTAVCFECHYNPQVITIQRLLEMGMIGPIYSVESDYYHGIGPWYKQWAWNVTPEEGGSSLLSAGCHALDLVMFFAGGNVTEVASFGGYSPNNPLAYRYPPHSVTILKFDNGVIGKCAASVDYRGPYYFPFEIQGEAGCIRDNRFYSTKLEGQRALAEIPTIMLDSGDVTHHPYEEEIADLIDCMLGDTCHPIDLDYAARTHEVIFAADRAAAEGRVVKMEEIRGEVGR